MIIGTAGHIDHGKTALVKALTGVNADRLPEEKARGITLDLGFAYVGEGVQRLGFVDVPGHEKLVHTMLAGAAGIDYVLLVVAADDGVMPQTREHLQIIDLLGLSHGAVAITKIDRVDAARVAAVTDELRALLLQTSLNRAPIFAVSSVTQQGIDVLRDQLSAAASEIFRSRRGSGFRLAIDRTLTLPGAGLVVTGTVYSGTAQIDDELTLSPSGVQVRVRSIRAQDRATSTVQAGERCGLNIVAPRLSKDAIARGDWLLTSALHAPTQRIDVQLRLLPHARVLTHWTPAHVHLAAAHTTARLVPLDRDSLLPGTSGMVQLVLDTAIGALNGDRIILRDASAQRTIGGGIVVDCFAPARQRKTPARLRALESARTTEPRARLLVLAAEAPLGIDLPRFCLSWNLAHADLLPWPHDLLAVGTQVFTRDNWQDLLRRALTALAQFHLAHADELGVDRARLRRMIAPTLHAQAYDHLVDELLDNNQLTKSGPWLHLPEHRVDLAPNERALLERVLPLIESEAFDPPWVRALAQTLNIAEAAMRTLLIRAARRGAVFQITRDLFYSAGAVQRLASIVSSIESEVGEVRAAQFRDATGLGRKRAIQLLEFFDRVGFTRRSGDAHRVRQDASVFVP